MPWFRCLARGENFKMLVDDVEMLMGFYTTRYVEAAGYGEAENAALAELKDDPFVVEMPDELKNKEARVYFDEIEHVASKPKRPNAGFVFFVMEDSEIDDPTSRVRFRGSTRKPMTVDSNLIYRLIAEVGKGEVSSYGMIASLIPGVGPRQVARAMRTAPKGLPWYRIITASGAMADHDGAARQRGLLKGEGVAFRRNGGVDWTAHRWKGPSQKWIEREGRDIHDVMEIVAGWR